MAVETKAVTKGFTRLVADLRDRLTVTKRLEEKSLHQDKDKIALIERVLAIGDDVEFITSVPEGFLDEEGYYGRFDD